MPLLNLQDFLHGLNESLTPPESLTPGPPPAIPIPGLPSPKLPEDILAPIFDIFTTSNFHNLRIAVQVNTYLYNRYRSQVYRYISLDKYKIGDFQLHATLNLAKSNSTVTSPKIAKRKLTRFTSFCHSSTHLEIADKESAQGLVEVLASSSLKNTLHVLQNVEYLILKPDFVRFLQKIDYHNPKLNTDKAPDSKRTVQLLVRYLQPRHMCIDTLRADDKKNPKSPEIWKIELLKRNWKIESMTFHNDVGDTRVIFTNVATQRFFVHTLYGGPANLVPSVDRPFDHYPSEVHIHQYTNFTPPQVTISAGLEPHIKSKDLKEDMESRELNEVAMIDR
uniref:Uncharacterized protein n=1 Tax=Kwoniella dejecticola CBS 10117 TaxID=1296121 RepID=A0A1A6A3T6_9TREE|nr:uncharacterized protein I303_05579 [Kwoniella dejecticola CBS 10117]OBR84720.1 hypothetical protein I303_05579 [Kwoniella dejecticola CBS 10117]